MNSWRNIEVSLDDKEIIAINKMELTLGNVPKQAYQVRRLITRFEVCHFKYQRHYKHILESIAILLPVVEVDQIGINHLHSSTWEKDTTGRSREGQMYVSALRLWLKEDSQNKDIETQGTFKLRQRVKEWLGNKNKKKEKLIQMLLARLFWQPVEEYRSGGMLGELERQIEATDICNYAFPQNLNQLIQAIGKLEPIKAYDGCGTFNAGIYSYLNKEFKELCKWLGEATPNVELGLGEKGPVKVWLVASLAKTIKVDIHLTDALPI